MITRENITGNGRSTLFEPDEQWKEALSRRQVYIRTFGCAYNFGDSHLLESVLKELGSTIVTDPGKAEIVVINTCIVIGFTERKMIREITSYHDQEVYVTGCLPLAIPAHLQDMPHVKAIHPDSIHRAADTVQHVHEGPVAVVQTGPGCAGSCRYCITRCARGTIRSRPAEKIHADIVGCAKGGAVEIRLAGQDLSAYGHDTGDRTLATLIKAIPPLPKDARIRLGMMNPATLKPIAREVAQVMNNGPFFRFLHLPVQSGSDRVLEMMGRGYRVADILDIIEIFKAEIQDITIATDIITGFPGETEKDHEQTMNLVRRLSPGMVNVTRYSWRPGTGMDRKNELPDRIRKDRSRAVIREAYDMFQKANEEKIGSVMSVIPVEKIRPGSVMARSDLYEGVIIREDYPPGIPFFVRITDCTSHYLIGERISE